MDLASCTALDDKLLFSFLPSSIWLDFRAFHDNSAPLQFRFQACSQYNVGMIPRLAADFEFKAAPAYACWIIIECIIFQKGKYKPTKINSNIIIKQIGRAHV